MGRLKDEIITRDEIIRKNMLGHYREYLTEISDILIPEQLFTSGEHQKNMIIAEIKLMQEALSASLEACKGAMRIQDLWKPTQVRDEHRGEAEALTLMEYAILRAIAKISGSWIKGLNHQKS